MTLIDKDLLPWLRLAHGLYNSVVIVLVLYQASLGFSVRRARRADAPVPVSAARRHRRFGPVLVLLGLAGFFAGLVVVTLGERNYLEHWHHLFTGMTIASLLLVSRALSLRIAGPASPGRRYHMLAGIAIVVLYLLEAFLGIGILL